MNEIEAIRWHLTRYRAVLTQQIDRLSNALEELQRTTLLLLSLDQETEEDIDAWLQAENFAVDEDGFFQSSTLVDAFRKGSAPADAISFSWGQDLRSDSRARRHLYRHRLIGPHLKHIHDRLGDVGWIYYQDAGNTALQYPYIDQRTAISSNFDWRTYHTYRSVCPENNPQRQIQWTPPTIDYAGEGLILSVSIPVWRHDAFIGLWSIDLPIRYLYRDFDLTKPFPDQMQFIVDQKGMLLLHDNLRAEIDQPKGQVFLHALMEQGGQWADIELSKLLAQEGDVLPITDAVGAQWVFCYTHVPGVEWTLFCGLPESSLEEVAAEGLLQAFQQIGEGNFSYRLESSSTKTYSKLVEKFNEMSLRLSQAEQHRITMENQLARAQKMEAVGRLAGGVAHDYNNMINVIMGYAELALEKLTKGDLLYHYIQQIYTAGRRSMDLTRQLLAFARRQDVTPEILDLNHAVNSMVNMLKRLIGEDVELVWKPCPQVWPIQIDPSQIDQILANLCVNARDAINGVGQMVIETANIEIDEAYCALHPGLVPGEYVQLVVSDNGTGIDREMIDKIFEPFFSTKPIGRGTGLGLATVYGIVRQNQGMINVRSEPGIGTSFTLHLPRATGQPETLSSNPVEILYGHNETVLLVEDEIGILELAATMLKHLGYRVLTAHSPAEAIQIAEQHPQSIDLLISDVIMPELNGRDLANRIRAFFPELPVLYMSGYTANIISDRGFLDKDVCMIQKPFSIKELAAKVREALTQTIHRSD